MKREDLPALNKAADDLKKAVADRSTGNAHKALGRMRDVSPPVADAFLDGLISKGLERQAKDAPK